MRTPRVSRIPLAAAVNVTPMIDVMLVLLITCMIVTPLVTSPAALPRSAHAEPRPEGPDDIVLVIDRRGAHYLSATGETAPAELRTVRAVGTDALGEWLRRLYAERTLDRVLYLKADRELPFGLVQDAIEIARRSGVRVVGAVTEDQRRRH